MSKIYKELLKFNEKTMKLKKNVPNALGNILPKGKYAHKEMIYIMYSHVHAN